MFQFLKLCFTLFWRYSQGKTAICKTRNTGMGNGMRRTRGMFTRIPRNLLEDSGESSHFSIPENAREDSGECSRRFRGIFKKISGNVIKGSGECSRGFREMFEKIPGNPNFDLFLEILLVF